MNENLYCWVDQNVVIQGPQKLPQNWQDPNSGAWYYNINNEAVWSDPNLLVIGWYPYIESDAGAPGPYYDRTLSDFVINPTNVVRTAIYTQWSIERVRQLKDAELESRIRIYETNQLAINTKIADYVNDDAYWYASQQAELARLTVWQDVADFDTSRPVVLPLANSYVGQSYVNQGLSLQVENDAAVAQSLAPRWDQAELDSFVAANQLAAADPSDATVPVQPTYKLRQGIAVPSEQFNRVVIFRDFNDNPNPALQTTYRMRMTNREDSRNIYIFSYTNGTYLTWRLFEDLGNGVWGLEATPAEWQYVPGDMAFIFSYGANPAVEADYFTERVEFPAGVQEKNILVAWDTQ